jgi:hypothetical protein
MGQAAEVNVNMAGNLRFEVSSFRRDSRRSCLDRVDVIRRKKNLSRVANSCREGTYS